MARKTSVHSLYDVLFFVLLLGVITFIVMSELRYQITRALAPFQFWCQLMYTNDEATKEYFYYLLNGNS